MYIPSGVSVVSLAQQIYQILHKHKVFILSQRSMQFRNQLLRIFLFQEFLVKKRFLRFGKKNFYNIIPIWFFFFVWVGGVIQSTKYHTHHTVLNFIMIIFFFCLFRLSAIPKSFYFSLTLKRWMLNHFTKKYKSKNQQLWVCFVVLFEKDSFRISIFEQNE